MSTWERVRSGGGGTDSAGRRLPAESVPEPRRQPRDNPRERRPALRPWVPSLLACLGWPRGAPPTGRSRPGLARPERCLGAHSGRARPRPGSLGRSPLRRQPPNRRPFRRDAPTSPQSALRQSCSWYFTRIWSPRRLTSMPSGRRWSAGKANRPSRVASLR